MVGNILGILLSDVRVRIVPKNFYFENIPAILFCIFWVGFHCLQVAKGHYIDIA